MRVRCRTNREADLSTPWAVGVSDGTFRLTAGKEYVVYALEWSAEGVPGYVLCYDGYWQYPLHYPAELFDITDQRPSRYWVVGFQPTRPVGSSGRRVPPQGVVGFPE